MAKIPTVLAEKDLDTADRTMPRLHAPDATGNALQSLGNTVSKIGEDLFDRNKTQSENLEDFTTDQKFQQFSLRQHQELEVQARNAQPGAPDLATNYLKGLGTAGKEWIEGKDDKTGTPNVPERLRERYKARFETLTARLEPAAANTEYTQRNDFYKSSIDSSSGQIAANVYNQPDVFNASREKLFSDIDKTSLPADQKAALKSRHGLLMGRAAVDGLIQQGKEDEARQLASTISGLNLEKPVQNNMEAADKALTLTPEERSLYKRHLGNLTSAGGVDNADGSRSTLKALTVGFDDKTYLIPTVWGGKIVDSDTAIANAKKQGLDNFPSYKSEAEATARYDAMHSYMDKDVGAVKSAGKPKPDAYARPDNFSVVQKQSRDAITREATRQGFSPETAIAVAMLESDLDPGNTAKPTRLNPNPTAKGLFQFTKATGIEPGNTADEQARTGVAWLKAKADELDKAGLPVTPTTLYMAHFQGTGGAKAILAAEPDAKLADVLDSAARKSGYGAQVIDGNKLPANITAGQFIEKINGRVNSALAAAGTTEIGFKERETFAKETETKINAQRQEKQKNDKEAIRTVDLAVDADLKSMRNTGRGDDTLSEALVSDKLGSSKAAQWLDLRERNRSYFYATKDFDSLPPAEIHQRLNELSGQADAVAGTPGYPAALENYHEAQKQADKVLKMREDDPARAVESDDSVKTSMQMLDDTAPQTHQALVSARLHAQSIAGIPPNAQEPLTNAEARQIAGTLASIPANKQRDGVAAVIQSVSDRYGEHADKVLTSIVGQFIKNKDLAELTAGLMKKAGIGRPLDPNDGRQADTAAEIIAADKAAKGTPAPLDPIAGVGQFGDGAYFGPPPGKREPSTPIEKEQEAFRQNVTPGVRFDGLNADIQRLIRNPSYAPQFDEIYGKGQAIRIANIQKFKFEDQDVRGGKK